MGYAPAEGMTDADMARRHAEVFLEVIRGEGFAKPNPSPMFPNPPGLLRVEPYSAGLRERIWWGAGTNATAEWAATPAVTGGSRRSLSLRAKPPDPAPQARSRPDERPAAAPEPPGLCRNRPGKANKNAVFRAAPDQAAAPPPPRARPRPACDSRVVIGSPQAQRRCRQRAPGCRFEGFEVTLDSKLVTLYLSRGRQSDSTFFP
jgi:hypothetical protein